MVKAALASDGEASENVQRVRMQTYTQRKDEHYMMNEQPFHTSRAIRPVLESSLILSLIYGS